jgi:hypothetical protein
MDRIPVIISVVALAVALVALLFGPGIAIRGPRAIQVRRRTRAARERQLLEYLRHAAMFLDGLPLFIIETWSWGPSVPNYAAGGTFPNQSSVAAQEMPSVVAAVDEALQLYVTHSHKQGLSFASKDDALCRLSEIQERFWKGTEEVVKSEWPLRWRGKMRELEELKLPNSERENILNLKNCKQRGS